MGTGVAGRQQKRSVKACVTDEACIKSEEGRFASRVLQMHLDDRDHRAKGDLAATERFLVKTIHLFPCYASSSRMMETR
jgi:hypothetical protein